MEFLQIYLPRRVPSNLDLVLNAAGAGWGRCWRRCWSGWAPSTAGAGFGRAGLCPMRAARWCCWRCGRWRCCFRRRCRLAWARCWSGWRLRWPTCWTDTPFLEWLPLRETELQPLSPGGELLCVMLGLLVPCLLGYCVIRQMGRRAVFALWWVGVAADGACRRR
jgi:hypothetical protein